MNVLTEATMRGALARYRVMANVVGVLLLILVFVAVPLQYGADQPTLASVLGVVHGIAYIVYLATAFDLGRRAGWRLRRLVAPVFAGFVPFLAFAVEHRTTRRIREEEGTALSTGAARGASTG